MVIYRSNRPGWVKYLGIHVEDGTGKGWIDLHKQEATNGCIFIVDPATPKFDENGPNTDLNAFEPKLIKEVLAAIGKKPEDVKGSINLGTMHVVDIK